MAKKHRAAKAFRKFRSFSKLQFRWTVNRFESPTFLSRAVTTNSNEKIQSDYFKSHKII